MKSNITQAKGCQRDQIKINGQCTILVPKNILDDARKLVNYAYRIEERHFEEYESGTKEKRNHIFLNIKRIDRFLSKTGLDKKERIKETIL